MMSGSNAKTIILRYPLLPLFSISLLTFSIPLAWSKVDADLAFSDALQAILERDTSIAIQKSRKESTDASAITSRTAFLPSLTLEHTEYRNKPRSVGNTLGSRRGGISASWNLFHFGADLANWQAASADMDSQNDLLKSQILLAEKSAAEKIFSAVLKRQAVEVAKKIYESQLELHHIAKLRYEKSLLPRQEVEKVFIDLENARARLKDAEIRASESDAQLVAALGHNRIRQEWPWKKLLADAKSNWGEKPLHFKNIPAWKAANYSQNAEDQRVKRNFRRMLPSLDLSADYNFRNTNYTNNEWSGALTLSFPIFDGLTNYSNYAAQVETRNIADLTLEQTRRDVEAEWKAAKDAFKTARETALSREKSQNLARRLYRDNELRFKSGKISANELVVDQERLFRAEEFAIEGWSTAHLAFVRLCHAYGERVEACWINNK